MEKHSDEDGKDANNCDGNSHATHTVSGGTRNDYFDNNGKEMDGGSGHSS